MTIVVSVFLLGRLVIIIVRRATDDLLVPLLETRCSITEPASRAHRLTFLNGYHDETSKLQ